MTPSEAAETADIDVGVIYTHERHFMPPLLTTLAESAPGLRLRLLLVDNASADGAEQWTGLGPPTTILRNERRLGYAANLNVICRSASAPYVLLMNTDMYFDPAERCVAKMHAFMEREPGCGVSICRLYHPDGTYGHPARRFQTWRAIAARRLGLGGLFSGSLGRYLYAERDRRSSFACDWVSGCFLFARREALAQVDGFDERLRKYLEDVDVCGRLAAAGWQVMFHGETYCYHHEQRASRRLLSTDAWRHLMSYLYWRRKRVISRLKGPGWPGSFEKRRADGPNPLAAPHLGSARLNRQGQSRESLDVFERRIDL